MLDGVRRVLGKLPRLPARFHIVFGLVSLVVSVVLLAMFLQVAPNAGQQKAKSRTELTEALAASTSMLLKRGDTIGIRDALTLVIERNPDLTSVELLRQRDKTARVFGAAPVDLSHSDDYRVPLYRGGREWGSLVFHFQSPGNPWWNRFRDSQFGLMMFVSTLCFPIFYLYLGRMLKALNPSEAVPGRVRSALDTIAEALLVLDKNGNLVLANAAFTELAGESAEVLVGQNAGELDWITDQQSVLVSDDESADELAPRAADTLPWLKTLETGDAVRNERIAYRSAEGKVCKYLMNCSPVATGNGKVGGVLISMDDVTLLEEKEVQLRQSMLEAEEANKAKSAFLSNMSHEIRTPMTAILGFTEVLRRGKEADPALRSKHLETIANSGQHLLELINDVLDLSKVEAGSLEVESINTNVCRIASEVVKVLKVKAEEKGVRLSLDIRSALYSEVLLDPSRLRQIMTNLVGNAIKFTEEGSVTLILERVDSADGNAVLQIRIKDTGIGMTAEQQATIFDAFTQADSTITRRFGGTGLGLSISRQLSQAMGGDVQVDSVPGQGSTFTVSLPEIPAEGEQLTDIETLLQALQSVETLEHASWTFPEARVLVVDDGAENRELLSLVLGDLGLQVDTAENGKIGLDKATCGQFDAVLMDIQMPVMDGYQAAAGMREAGIELPIVALTANAMKGFEKKVFAAGFSHYQTKPIDIDKLTALLAELLGGQQVEKAEPVPLQGTSAPEGKPSATQAIQAESATDLNDAVSDEPIYSTLVAQNARFQPIAEQFVAKFRERLPSMRQELDSGAFTTLAESAHWLKGSSGNVGFDELHKLAKALEKAALAEQSEAASQTFDQMSSMATRLTGGAPTSDNVAAVTNQNSSAADLPSEVDTTHIRSQLLEQSTRFLPIVEQFMGRLIEEVAAMQKALESGDYEDLSLRAHWLKGSGGNIGYPDLHRQAKALENAARTSDQASCEKEMMSINNLKDRIVQGWESEHGKAA